MHTYLATQCLKTMGIEVWRQCRVLARANQLVNFEVYKLYDPLGAEAGRVCLQSKLMKPSQELAMLCLLDAMLAAINLQRGSLADSQDMHGNGLVLLMGEELAQQALNSAEPLDRLRADNIFVHSSGAKLLVTYHPLDLLAIPANKAKAWEDLKKLLVS